MLAVAFLSLLPWVEHNGRKCLMMDTKNNCVEARYDNSVLVRVAVVVALLKSLSEVVNSKPSLRKIS